MNNNFNIYTDNGSIRTDDDDINRIITAVETETGAKLATAIPAVTFGEDPDEKIYLLLLTIYTPDDNNDDVMREWSIMIGRQNVYNNLKMLTKNDCIDPNKSFIVACKRETDETINKENISLDQEPITVFRFLKVMREGKKVLDGDEMFDINEFDLNDPSGDTTILEV